MGRKLIRGVPLSFHKAKGSHASSRPTQHHLIKNHCAISYFIFHILKPSSHQSLESIVSKMSGCSKSKSLVLSILEDGFCGKHSEPAGRVIPFSTRQFGTDWLASELRSTFLRPHLSLKHNELKLEVNKQATTSSIDRIKLLIYQSILRRYK